MHKISNLTDLMDKALNNNYKIQEFPIKCKGFKSTLAWAKEIEIQIDSIYETLEWMEFENLSWCDAWEDSDTDAEEFLSFVDTITNTELSFLEDCILSFESEFEDPLLTDFIESAATYTQNLIEELNKSINLLAEEFFRYHLFSKQL